jgi:hypothetical protein
MTKQQLTTIVTAILLTTTALSTSAKNCEVDKRLQSNNFYLLSKKAENNHDLKKAVYLARQATLACTNYKNWFLLAKLRQDLGVFSDSKSAYKEAITLATNDEEKALSIAGYGESTFMLGNLPEATYAFQTAIELLSNPPQWMLDTASQLKKNLKRNYVKRGFDPIDINSYDFNEQQRIFSKKIEDIVKILGGETEQAFEILAQKEEEQYGQKNYRQYASYLKDILSLKKSIESGAALFDSLNLVDTVEALTSKFQKNGEELSKTIERIRSTNQSMGDIGFNSNTIEGSLTNQKIADAVGGLDTLNKIVDEYRQRLFILTTGSNDTLSLLRETVRLQFLELDLKLTDFSTTEKFFNHTQKIKNNLNSDLMVKHLQAGKSLELLIEQEKLFSSTLKNEDNFIANIDNSITKLKNYNLQNLTNERDLEKADLLAQLYIDISSRLSKKNHNESQ